MAGMKRLAAISVLTALAFVLLELLYVATLNSNQSVPSHSVNAVFNKLGNTEKLKEYPSTGTESLNNLSGIKEQESEFQLTQKSKSEVSATVQQSDQQKQVVSYGQSSQIGLELLSNTQSAPPLPSNQINHSIYSTMDAYKKSYMLSLHYAEQLSNAGQHFISFLNMAAVHFNMTGVIPLISGSRMFGLQSIHPTTSVSMERLFDLTILDRKLRNCLYGGTESTSRKVVNSREEFLLYSHREIILVYIVDHVGALNYLSNALSLATFKDLDKKLSLGPSIATECTAEMNKTRRGSNPLQRIEELLNSDVDSYNKVERFHIIRSYCVNRKVNSTVEKLREIILRNRSRVDASVLFVTWQGGITGGAFQQGLTKCRESFLPMSTEVINTTEIFFKSLEIVKPFISVHLRLEWVFAQEHTNYMYTDCCITRLAELINEVAEKYQLHNSKVVLIKDFGTYGSDSCNVHGTWSSHEVCMVRSDKAIALLKQISNFAITTVEFNATMFKSVPTNTGFASLVESQALTEGAVLITLGGGNFHRSIRDRFNQKHSVGKDRHYGVCPDVLPAIKLQSHTCTVAVPGRIQTVLQLLSQFLST